MKIGLYGGTFNPPHRGHEKAACAFLKEIGLDRLFVIPAGIPPHKVVENAPSKEDRLALCRRAFLPLSEKIEIWDGEISSPEISYTYRTVQKFRERFPEDGLFLLVGTDMFLTFEQWREFSYLLSACTLCCAPRTDEREAIFEKKAQLEADFAAQILLLEEKPYIISSSEIREEIVKTHFSFSLSPGVNDWIELTGLYGSGKSDPLRRKILARLKKEVPEERLRHILSVERECYRLTRLLGKEELLPGICHAALLHDLARHSPVERQLEILKKYGVPVQREDLNPPVLLHGVTAAAIAAEEYGLAPIFTDAIRYHTTLRAASTVADRILYLADGIEETRTHAACRKARADFEADLQRGMAPQRAFLRANIRFLEASIAHEKAKGSTVHPASCGALQDLQKEWEKA